MKWISLSSLTDSLLFVQLVLMSLDRYLAVAHPITSMSLRTVKNAHRAILVMWAVIIVFCIQTSVTHDVNYINENASTCTFKTEEFSYILYQSSFFLFSFIIPIFVIIILYLLMLKRLWVGGNGGFVGRNARSKKKVTRMVSLVTLIFTCCWITLQVVLLLKSIELYPYTPLSVSIQIIGHVLGKCQRGQCCKTRPMCPLAPLQTSACPHPKPLNWL